MARFIKNRTASAGKSPGSLIHIGTQKMDNSRVRLIQYSPSAIIEKQLALDESLRNIPNDHQITWINIDGLHDVDLMKKVKDEFQIPPLIMEDMMNTDSRPKLLETENHIIILLKVFYINKTTNKHISEQISFVLGKNYVLTIQEREGQFFEKIRERIRNNIGTIRHKKADYLQYTLIDSVIDSYLLNLEKIGGIIENQEENVIESEARSLAETLYLQKTEVSFIRKTIRPVKEIILRVFKCTNSIMESETLHYWKDLEELAIQANEVTEVYYAMLTDQINLHQTNISNKANDVMKILTIFASIFIPLTFIAGIYGTNFDHIPELHFKYGYYAMWGAMIIITLFMLLYFKIKKWF